MILLTALAWIVAAPLCALTAILLVELCAGLLPPSPRRNQPGALATMPHAPQTAILMPAHNEANGIADIIEHVKPALNDKMRLVVIADNCSDDTAAVARQAGAFVIERNDQSKRGKGHALAFGRDWLKRDSPECVIILDADCIADPGALDALAYAAVALDRPVQGAYLLRAEPEAGPMIEISNFAFLIKNLVRQRGDSRLGAPAILGGTGMAFPWRRLESAPLATSDLVEDLALGVHFARSGAAPRFIESARIWSAPAPREDTLAQRTRWEHGFVSTAISKGWPLIGEGLRRGRGGLVWLGLHLLVPPLALLVALLGLGFAVCAALALSGAFWAPSVMLLVALGALALLLAANWAMSGRTVISAATLARIPFYIAWKIPVYLKLVRGPQSEWIRTRRSGE